MDEERVQTIMLFLLIAVLLTRACYFVYVSDIGDSFYGDTIFKLNLLVTCFDRKNKEEESSNDSIGEELNGINSDSVCKSLDDITNFEIESFKNKVKSKLIDIDYETYVKQFWLGLLEGDGTITVSSPGPNQVKFVWL